MVEQIGFEARDSEYIDAKSGVSARMSISIFENLLSTAERRSLLTEESNTSVRLLDFLGTIPAITGKVELVYEGEQEGAGGVAQIIIKSAVKTLFLESFPEVKKLSKASDESPYDEIRQWFYNEEGVELLDDMDDGYFQNQLDAIKPLNDLIKKYVSDYNEKDIYFIKEFVLWALVELKILNKERFTKGFQFNDPLSNYMKGI